MEIKEFKQNDEIEELPDEWWHRVYLGVIAATFFIITALWAFSRYFSG